MNMNNELNSDKQIQIRLLFVFLYSTTMDTNTIFNTSMLLPEW